MFVSLQGDVKQCCDITRIVFIVQADEPFDITALFGILLETSEHENITKLWCQTLLKLHTKPGPNLQGDVGGKCPRAQGPPAQGGPP